MTPRIRMLLLLALTLALALATAGIAAGQEGEPLPCQGDHVSGTVVAVDEEAHQVTIDTGDELCTVMLNGDFHHPIVALLGAYFDDVKAENLAAALETLSVEVVCTEMDGTMECALVGEGETGTPATVLSVTDNGDGTFTVEVLIVDEEGNESTQTFVLDDETLAGDLNAAIAALMVDWDLHTDEDGNVIVTEVGDEIAALHGDGWGFGNLVKAYSIAQDVQDACALGELSGDICDTTVEDLLAAREDGAGWGQLFKLYGKPSLLGIGHVIQQIGPPGHGNGWACGQYKKNGTTPPAGSPCDHGNGHGNGNGNGKGNGGGPPPWAGGPGGPGGGDD